MVDKMLLHASCIAINHKAVLLLGPSGIGKSDLALRLIDEGAGLVSDDQTLLHLDADGSVLASSPPSIAGLMEIRHIGLVKMPFIAAVPVALYIELILSDQNLERLPDEDFISLLDRPVPRLKLPSVAASTPAKIRAALTYAKIK